MIVWQNSGTIFAVALPPLLNELVQMLVHTGKCVSEIVARLPLPKYWFVCRGGV